MKRTNLLAASAVLLALGAAPAHALSVVQAKNSDGSPRFADPDAAFDQQFDDYQNGRLGGGMMQLGDGARFGGVAVHRDTESSLARRDRRDHTCVDCSSVNIDGLWVLRPASADADADNASQ